MQEVSRQLVPVEQQRREAVPAHAVWVGEIFAA